jgi:hypothetical protein
MALPRPGTFAMRRAVRAPERRACHCIGNQQSGPAAVHPRHEHTLRGVGQGKGPDDMAQGERVSGT